MGLLHLDSMALAVRYIQKPQDGHADTVAKLSFSPSYITYNPVTIETVKGFFRTGEVSVVWMSTCFSISVKVSIPFDDLPAL